MKVKKNSYFNDNRRVNEIESIKKIYIIEMYFENTNNNTYLKMFNN